MLLEQQQERPEKFRSVWDSNHDLCNAGAIIGILILDNPSVQSTVINGVLQIGLKSQFWGGRKPECLEKIIEVRLRSSKTQSTYNIVVEVEGVIDVHCTSLTSQGVQHRVFYLDGHPSRYQPRPTGLNFGEQTGTSVSLWWWPYNTSAALYQLSYSMRPTGSWSVRASMVSL